MKKTLNIIASAVIALAAITSCAKEQLIENVLPAGEAIQVSINGQIGELTPADATKATAGSVVRVTWETGDKVYVYDGSTDCIGTLTVTPDEKNASYALLSGTITSEASPSKLTLVYVKGETEAPTIAGGKISIPLSTQDKADVPFVLYSTIDYDAAKLAKENEYISFSFATSVMTVNCTGLPTNEGSKIDITKAEIDGVSTVCELTVTGSGVTVAGASKGTITRSEAATPSVFTQSDSRGSFKLALAADPETPAARNILVYQDSKVYGSPFTSATLAVNKSYNTVYQLGEYVAPPDGILPGVFSVADGKTVHFSKGNLYYDGRKFNFEANQYDSTSSSDKDWSADHISHFYWSKDPNEAIKEEYNWDQAVSDEDVFFTNADDFTVNVGDKEQGGWRTLSTTEWNYLFAWDPTLNFYAGGFNAESPRYGLFKCSVTVCGKTNCVVLLPDDWKWGENGVGDTWQLVSEVTEYSEETTITWSTMEAAGAVCLPAAGYRDVSDVWYVGDIGYYWSSSADCSVYFNSGKVNPNSGGDRYNSYSVRLITEASDGYAPAVKVESVILNKSEIAIKAGAKDTLAATVTPAKATHKEVIWSSSKTSVATVDSNGEVTGVAAGSAVITATTADGNFTAVCIVTVMPREFVDLGLPSGLKWRVCNLGAENPWEYGKYFQWGDITGNVCNGTTNGSTFEGGYDFKISNAPFHTGTSTSTGWTKYIPTDKKGYWSGTGTPDNKLVLDSEDDAASEANPDWRMPTKEEFKELCENTTSTWETDYNGTGISGRLFTSKKEGYTDKSVFFPAAGYPYEAKLKSANSSGYYWSSSLYSSTPYYAYYLYFSGSNVDSQNNSARYSGFSVRPVKD